MAVRLVEAKDGVMQLVAPLRELPLVQMDALNAKPFKRLARLADAHDAMPTARIRSLATRLSVGLPDDNDSSETGRVKWVWQLVVLERSITIQAIGHLKAAQADGKWDKTVAALDDTGRFTVPWMAAARAAKQAATAAAAAAAVGRGFENIPILDIVTHVMTTVPATDVNALAKQFAYATAGVHGAMLPGTTADVWKNACGMSLQRVMRREITVWTSCRFSRRRSRTRFQRCWSACFRPTLDRRRRRRPRRRRQRHRRRRPRGHCLSMPPH